jgi:triosephosphate isomerase
MNVLEINPVNPLIVINFKTYLEATGKKAVELSRTVEEISRKAGVRAAVAPQFSDLSRVAAEVSIPVFAQHVDSITPGASTGHILAESLEAAGATGTILNHSEHTLRLVDIQNAIMRIHDVGLLTIVCASNAQSAAAIALMNPDVVAIEPPELIGTGRAVSKEKPEVIKDTIRKIRAVNSSVKILCGAGICTGEDIYAALQLGAEGFLVASGVVKSPAPTRVMTDFCEAAKRFTERAE